MQKVKDVARYLNSEKKRSENILKAEQYFRQFGLEREIDSVREFIHEGISSTEAGLTTITVTLFRGDIPKNTAEHRAVKKKFTLYFFTDTIILTRIKDSGSVIVKKFPVNSVIWIDGMLKTYQIVTCSENEEKLKIGSNTFCAPQKNIHVMRDVVSSELKSVFFQDGKKLRSRKLAGLL